MAADNESMAALLSEARAAKAQLLNEMALLAEDRANLEVERAAFKARDGQLTAALVSRGIPVPSLAGLPPQYAAALTGASLAASASPFAPSVASAGTTAVGSALGGGITTPPSLSRKPSVSSSGLSGAASTPTGSGASGGEGPIATVRRANSFRASIAAGGLLAAVAANSSAHNSSSSISGGGVRTATVPPSRPPPAVPGV